MNNASTLSKSLLETGYTSHNRIGDRYVFGTGNLPGANSLQLPLPDVPVWVVCAPKDEGSVWLVAMTDGSLKLFEISGMHVSSIPIIPDKLPVGMPPLLLVYEDGSIKLGNVLSTLSSDLSNPAILNKDSERLAFLGNNGDVIIKTGADETGLQVNALPDARILVDESEKAIVLTDPTSLYAHGVLGDAIEAGSFTLIETRPVPRVSAKVEIESPSVIEGIAPLWADLNGDGEREIIVTVSDLIHGARFMVFDESGQYIARSKSIGRGYRWRNHISVAPFGPSGELELVSVLTPHIGGIVEYFQLIGDSLVNVAQVSGCTSHVIGSRNLDMALAGDFDGDGQIELLLPSQALTELCAVQRTAESARIIWSIPLEGQMSSNLAAVTLATDEILLGVGTDDKKLIIWLR